MFLTYIDPLDEAVAGVHYRDRDREYFKYLLERVYPPEIRIPTSNLGIAGHAPTSIIGTPSKGEFAAPTS
jgi:hypothetical protein